MSLSTLALTACGSDATAKPAATPEPSPPIAAYTALAEDFTGFFVAMSTAPLDGAPVPETVEDLLAVADYKFRDGVTLADFGYQQEQLCLSGPENTYLTMSTADDFKRTLGTGECNYEDGEVVLEEDTAATGATVSSGEAMVVEKVVKGGDIAEKIPALDEFGSEFAMEVRNKIAEAAKDTGKDTENANK